MGSSGWRSRGYLPHFDSPEKLQLITFRLGDALPKHAIDQIVASIGALPEDRRKAEQQRRLQEWLDSGHGACYLRKPEIAGIVEDQLLLGDGSSYRLIEWTIMPNHVHALVEIEADVDMYVVVKRWKGPTAVLCNRLLGRKGTFWFPEYHDRFMRDEAHFRNTVRYIHLNPVKAGLCAHPADWPFGSARLRDWDVP
ncbi:MAG TPA: transposase [Fimbriimonadaceae bacterium]|nr:transposase [Fimbriimonadaceae bacterium]